MNATITESLPAPRLSRPVQHALLMAGILGVNLAASNGALAQSAGIVTVVMPSVSGCATVFNPFYTNTAFSGFTTGSLVVSTSFTLLTACANPPLTTTITTIFQGVTLIFIPTAAAAPAPAQSVPINSAPALAGLAAALAFSARRIRNNRRDQKQRIV